MMSDLGYLVKTRPQSVLTILWSEFSKHRTKEAVAKALGVNRSTILRWIRQLEAMGYEDPREILRREGMDIPKPWKRTG